MQDESPFAVLGIAPDADDKSIKRAYATLIRQHRPDRDPAAFARIHAAYEAVLGTRRGRVPLLRGSAPVRSSEAPQQNDEGPPSDREAAPSEEKRAEAERFEPGERAEPIAFAPPITLEQLVARVGDERGAHLVNEATDRLLLGGHGDYLWRELTSPAADRLLLSQRSIEPALLKTSAFLAYVSSHRAKELLDRVRLEANEHRYLEDRALLAAKHAKGFRASGGLTFPKELRRLIRLVPIVWEDHAQELIEDVLEFARSHPDDFLDYTGELDSGLLDAIGLEALSFADVEGVGAESAHAIREPLATLAASIERYERGRTSLPWLSIAAFVAGIYLMFSLLPWAAISVSGMLLGGLVIRQVVGAFSRHEDRTTAAGYRAQVRSALLELTVETGVAPRQLVSFIGKSPNLAALRPYGQRILCDASLQFAHRLARGAGGAGGLGGAGGAGGD